MLYQLISYGIRFFFAKIQKLNKLMQKVFSKYEKRMEIKLCGIIFRFAHWKHTINFDCELKQQLCMADTIQVDKGKCMRLQCNKLATPFRAENNLSQTSGEYNLNLEPASVVSVHRFLDATINFVGSIRGGSAVCLLRAFSYDNR